MIKNCLECGTEFEANKYTPYQRFCSDKCREKNWREKNRERLRKHQKKYREINKEKIRKKQKRRQKRLDNYKTKLGCQYCGYNKYAIILQFHHKFGKDFHIDNNRFIISERTKKELEKCILLCANCHKEEHIKIKEKKDGCNKEE